MIKCREGRFYIGYTTDLEKRLQQHNEGKSFWTKRYSRWEVVHKEEYSTRREALEREKYLKKLKCGNKFKNIISQENKSRGGAAR